MYILSKCNMNGEVLSVSVNFSLETLLYLLAFLIKYFNIKHKPSGHINLNPHYAVLQGQPVKEPGLPSV